MNKEEAMHEIAREMIFNKVFDEDIKEWILAGDFDKEVIERAKEIGMIEE